MLVRYLFFGTVAWAEMGPHGMGPVPMWMYSNSTVDTIGNQTVGKTASHQISFSVELSRNYTEAYAAKSTEPGTLGEANKDEKTEANKDVRTETKAETKDETTPLRITGSTFPKTNSETTSTETTSTETTSTETTSTETLTKTKPFAAKTPQTPATATSNSTPYYYDGNLRLGDFTAPQLPIQTQTSNSGPIAPNMSKSYKSSVNSHYSYTPSTNSAISRTSLAEPHTTSNLLTATTHTTSETLPSLSKSYKTSHKTSHKSSHQSPPNSPLYPWLVAHPHGGYSVSPLPRTVTISHHSKSYPSQALSLSLTTAWLILALANLA